MHVSKHYVYEGGTLLFDLRDNKTNLFVKYNDRISFVDTISFTVLDLSKLDHLEGLYSKEYQLGNRIRTWVRIDPEVGRDYQFDFFDSQNGNCVVIFRKGFVESTYHLVCDINNVESMIPVVNYFLSMESQRRDGSL